MSLCCVSRCTCSNRARRRRRDDERLELLAVCIACMIFCQSATQNRHGFSFFARLRQSIRI
eukprot:5982040-Pleurochrysis_carterae.AAC.1